MKWKWILRPLVGLCLLGLLISLTLCFLAWVGIVTDPERFWFLHLLALAVFIPTIFAIQHMARHVPSKDLWKATLAGCPKWMRTTLWIIFGFGMVQFIAAVFLAKNQLAAASGHWSIFFALAFAVYYSRLQAPHLYRKRQCPCGHEVAPSFQFCPTCGEAITRDSPTENR